MNDQSDQKAKGRLNTVNAAMQAERNRVDAMLKRDAAERSREETRIEALARVEGGTWVNPEHLAVPPTDEWLSAEKGDIEHIKAQKDSIYQRDVPTVRRVQAMRIVRLHAAGVLDDDRFVACKFYRDKFEASGLLGSYAASKLAGAGGRGEVDFGQMARTEREAEARRAFRFCQAVLDERYAPGFNYVVLDDLGLREAATLFKVRDRTMKQIVVIGSLRLFQELTAAGMLDDRAQKQPSIARA